MQTRKRARPRRDDGGLFEISIPTARFAGAIDRSTGSKGKPAVGARRNAVGACTPHARRRLDRREACARSARRSFSRVSRPPLRTLAWRSVSAMMALIRYGRSIPSDEVSRHGTARDDDVSAGGWRPPPRLASYAALRPRRRARSLLAASHRPTAAAIARYVRAWRWWHLSCVQACRCTAAALPWRPAGPHACMSRPRAVGPSGDPTKRRGKGEVVDRGKDSCRGS